MTNLNEFFYWFINLGGDTARANFKEVHDNVNSISLQFSTLKNRAAEIKEKYNYKFSN
jgi:hypothetical protein